jgi:GH25 family lysozyme M1 (1,4-beta-N-acetylmuramidase)
MKGELIMAIKGIKAIDVSKNQGTNIDYAKVMSVAGIQFAIGRITVRSGSVDAGFEKFMTGTEANGIKRSAYKFSYALNVDQSVAEAKRVLEVLNGRHLDAPFFLDLEWSVQYALGLPKVVDIALAFFDVMNQGGYKCGIYCNTEWRKFLSADSRLNDVDYWIARYGKYKDGELHEDIRPNMGEVGWQYSESGRIAGITANTVDLNDWQKLYWESTPDETATIDEPAKQPEDVDTNVTLPSSTENPILDDSVNDPEFMEFSMLKEGTYKISKNFRVREFGTVDSDKVIINKKLADALQKTRDLIGKPIYIRSAYCTNINTAHSIGTAVVVYTKTKIDPVEIARCFEAFGANEIVINEDGSIYAEFNTDQSFTKDNKAIVSFFPTLKYKSVGDDVVKLQELLNRLAEKRSSSVMSIGKTNVNYGPITKNAIIAVQVILFKDPTEHDGVAGPKTWSGIYNLLVD